MAEFDAVEDDGVADQQVERGRIHRTVQQPNLGRGTLFRVGFRVTTTSDG